MEKKLQKMKKYFEHQKEEIKRENFLRDLESRSKFKFNPRTQCENIVVDYDLERAIKIKSDKPTFTIINNTIEELPYCYLSLKCVSEIGVGYCCPYAV